MTCQKAKKNPDYKVWVLRVKLPSEAVYTAVFLSHVILGECDPEKNGVENQAENSNTHAVLLTMLY